MLRLFRQYYPIRNVIFAVGEGLVIYCAVLLAAWIKLGGEQLSADKWVVVKSLLITLVCQISLYYHDLYDLKVTNSFTELGLRLLQALGIVAIFFGLIYFFMPPLMIGEGIFVLIVGLLIVLIVSWRIGYSLMLDHGLFNQKIFIMGSGQLANDLIHEISEKKDSGYEIVAVIDDKTCGDMHYAQHKELSRKAETAKISKIVVALEEKRGYFPSDQLLECRFLGIDILEGTSFYEMLMGKLHVYQINPAYLIFSEGYEKSKLKNLLKRTGDLFLASFMLVLLSPLILITALLIKIESRGPVIFSQERVGENGKRFQIRKFRSMVADAEKKTGPVWASEDDNRITRVGRVIRKLRIDEIPQLWNVLKGEMSFVGPRPERAHFIQQLVKQIPYYTYRLSVKPGITGWAQVSYGYGATTDDAVEKLNYDLFYIKNISFLLDLLIIFRTVKTVLFGKGAR